MGVKVSEVLRENGIGSSDPDRLLLGCKAVLSHVTSRLS